MNHPMNISENSGAEDAGPRVLPLNDDECWEFLNHARFARLATADDHDVDITPLNIAVSDRRIYFKTAAGHKLTSMLLNPSVAVETDRVEGGIAQSVVVRGTAKLLTDSSEIARIEDLGITPWLHTEKLEYVEITPTRITGRRFRLGE
ncbi:pyridoxamine 5'-phosphate oxidase family protein [uncultured Kocuria sp.]|uniref:pyridoxamine 5'-phosphate oxidase family protein n=1 Tax=uncultured Kocuria sp. TaxID=259305 RepID=UPI00259226A9|nr:pyridoxamine 5'-phosphate oxidase family protein [uncultured Kocuria sp.]MCT1367956.1 pyridoxamine 5'-phosphate oxidase family protein [Rothia sp. p3-SID1597]